MLSSRGFYLCSRESLHKTTGEGLTLQNELCSPWKIHAEKEKHKFWTDKEIKSAYTHTLRIGYVASSVLEGFFSPPGLHFFLQHVNLKWTKSGDWCQGTKIKKGAIFSHSSDILQSLVWKFKAELFAAYTKTPALSNTPGLMLSGSLLSWVSISLRSYYTR